MTKAIAIFKLTALLALTALLVAATAAAWEFRSVAIETRKTITSDFGIKGTIQSLNGVLQQAGAVFAKVREISEENQKKANETADETLKATKEARQAIEDFRKTIGKVNEEVIPQFTTTLKNTDENVAKLTSQAAESLKEITGKANVVLDDAHKLVSDPNIQLAIEEVRLTLAEARKSAENVTAMSNDGKAMTADAKEAFHRATRPGSLVIKAFTAALGLTVKAAEIVAGFFK